MSNTSQNVLITGVSTGIGFESAIAFANAGCRVYGTIRKPEDATALKDRLGDRFHSLILDVVDHQSIDQAAAELTKLIDREGLACLINNAGIATGGPLMHLPIEDLRYQFEVNVIGLVKVTQAFLPLLGARKDHPVPPGKIINISSVAGKIGMPFIGAYAGSKHAVEGISDSLRRELMLFGIDVIVVGPGAIKTPIWNKGLDVDFADTDYAEPLKLFGGKIISGTVKNALDADSLAEDIYKIFQNPRPKTRYAFVPQKFKTWILPRILPVRVLDGFLGKALRLRKESN
ncbi:MAG: SDR family oxidoreductase [Cyclobacteriaceae bacterium]